MPIVDFQNVSAAFSRQSSSFDDIEENNEILQWMRMQIHAHCSRHFKPGDHILELNCGTGIDAVFFAEQGMKVHATDLSDGMLGELKKIIFRIKYPFSNVHLQNFKKLKKIISTTYFLISAD